jgi:hypothetical protein
MKSLALLAVVLAAFAVGSAQQADSPVECSRHLPSGQKLRVSPGVIEMLLQSKVLPDASDLKAVKGSNVTLHILIDETGAVACAAASGGQEELYPRSLEAARKWTFKPYLISGKPVIVEGGFVLHYNKGKVVAKFPDAVSFWNAKQ